MIWKNKSGILKRGFWKSLHQCSQRENKNFNENSLRDLSNNNKHSNIHIIEVTEEKTEKGRIYEDILTEKIP